ncbi:unnamed protein product [Umbelopsis ramanniana]
MSTQQPDSYLKSLSKKQYSWMQQASSPQSDSAGSPEPERPTKASSVDNAATTESVKTTELEVPSDTPSQPNDPMDTSTDVEPDQAAEDHNVEDQNDDKASSRPRDIKSKPTSRPRFKYTNFPVKGFNILPTRNITSQYAKNDSLSLQGILTGEKDIQPDPETEGSDVIIIHPGSRSLRIGRASEAFPTTVPHVIARRMKTKQKKRSQPRQMLPMDFDLTSEEVDNDTEMKDAEDEEVDAATNKTVMTSLQIAALDAIEGTLKYRMKQAKRRSVPNANAQVISYNSQAVQEIIPDHNDPYKVEWTDPSANGRRPAHFVGEKALNLPLDANPDYGLFYPMQYGQLNSVDYTSLQEVVGDLQAIWTESIQSELEIEEAEFKNFNAILVIPDVYNRNHISEIVTMMLRYMKFRGVCVQQESTCATFGAGTSMACVVDIGAQKTSVSCVEDGLCIPDSRITLPMGGDDITTVFASFLKRNKFPYSNMDISLSYNWRLFEGLKEKWCTLNEAEISVQVYDFFVRVPEKPTRKFQCKVYEEVFLAPLCLIFPGILDPDRKAITAQKWSSENVIDDIADEAGVAAVQTQPAPAVTLPVKSKPSTPLPSGLSPSVKPATAPSTPTASDNVDSPAPAETEDITPTQSNVATSESPMSPEKVEDAYIPTPIDTAIAQSILISSSNSEERMKKFFTSIILVGGGGKIVNMDRLLEDCILSTSLARKHGVDKVEILPAPRELDPRLLVWKGAYVLSKLESTNEMWIGQDEWNEVGVRCLRDRMLFVW